MKDYVLRIAHDRLGKGQPLALGALDRVVYCRQGKVQVTSNGRQTTLGEDEAVYTGGTCSVEALDDASVAWRWELAPVDAASGKFAQAELGANTDVRGEYPLPSLVDGMNYALRCDRVSFPPGGEALTHTHAAAGVRCVHNGQITAECLGKLSVYKPGDTWLERGPDHVYAKTWDEGPMSFIRVMLIPETHFGRSTISYVRAEDQDKPKSQQYHRYLEEKVTLE